MREIREFKGMSQQDVVNELNKEIKISRPSYVNFEAGQPTLNLEMLKSLVKILGITPAFLFQRSDYVFDILKNDRPFSSVDDHSFETRLKQLGRVNKYTILTLENKLCNNPDIKIQSLKNYLIPENFRPSESENNSIVKRLFCIHNACIYNLTISARSTYVLKIVEDIVGEFEFLDFEKFSLEFESISSCYSEEHTLGDRSIVSSWKNLMLSQLLPANVNENLLNSETEGENIKTPSDYYKIAMNYLNICVCIMQLEAEANEKISNSLQSFQENTNTHRFSSKHDRKKTKPNLEASIETFVKTILDTNPKLFFLHDSHKKLAVDCAYIGFLNILFCLERCQPDKHKDLQQVKIKSINEHLSKIGVKKELSFFSNVSIFDLLLNKNFIENTILQESRMSDSRRKTLLSYAVKLEK